MKNYNKKLIIMFVMLLTVIGFGIIQNGTVANAAVATVGQQLKTQEEGWRRYDDSDINIEHSSKLSSNNSSWFVQNKANCYNGTILSSPYGSHQNEYFAFNFYGTKLRVISPYWWSSTSSVNVYIDNVLVGSFSEKSSSDKFQTLVYEINGLSLTTHSVKMVNQDSTIAYFCLDAVDVDENGYLSPYNEVQKSISLDKSSIDVVEGNSEQLSATTTPSAIGVSWKSSDISVATVDENGKIVAIKEGQATITATTTDGSNLSASCTVNVTKKEEPPVSLGKVLNIEPEKNNIHLNEVVSANLTIDNIKEIAAEDIRIKYDNTKLKFLGMDEVDGIKLVKSETNDGELRVIVASKGLANIVNDKKTLLKLNFQGIASGEALVDVTKGRVSDGIEMEKDLTDEECGQATIIIDEIVLDDVNHSGEFTLLDLAIDARHLGENPTSLSQYNTDQVINGAIDNDDLLKIGEYMINNPNYSFN